MRQYLETCPFNAAGFTVDSLHSQTDTNIHILKTKARNGDNYRLSFAPVGNTPAVPSVIIVGKTPGLKTLGKAIEWEEKAGIKNRQRVPFLRGDQHQRKDSPCSR